MEEKNSYLSADPETIRQIDEKMPPEEELQDLAEFFKGRDADVMTAAFQEFSAKKLNRDKKPSIRKALAAAKDKAKQLNAARDKVKKIDRGREI